MTLTSSGNAPADAPHPEFSTSKPVSRINRIDGVDKTVDSRNVTVSADVTSNLRDGQIVNLSWKGARPTAGVNFDPNSQYAYQQEYPVAILQCRGVDSPTASAQQVAPETCFTPTTDSRYEPPYKGDFPPYRLDRYATASERALSAGRPADAPAACPSQDGFDAEHWVPFAALDGRVYAGGSPIYSDCADISPDQADVLNPSSPPNTTWGSTTADGSGTAKFYVQADESNASLGCSSTVACSIVVIPIEGVSCDDSLATTAMDPKQSMSDCTTTGQYQVGAPGPGGNDALEKMAVTGGLWWSASNWRNRITIPISFVPSVASACASSHAQGTANVYGSQAVLAASQSWAAGLCEIPGSPRLNHIQLSETAAKNLLSTSLVGSAYGGVEAAFQAQPPDQAFNAPVVQAPTAVTGFAIAYTIDDPSTHQPYTSLKLNARLLAKLLTMSYPDISDMRNAWKTCCGADKDNKLDYASASNNPLDISQDPEFQALNPSISFPLGSAGQDAAATLLAMSSDSDVMQALTSYINSDPDARTWLDGTPDPWGMVVNPSYKKIALPVSAWPQLDTLYVPLSNPCIDQYKTPFLPLVASPLSNPSLVAYDLQFGISTSQLNCDTGNQAAPQLKAVGRQNPGSRFILGLVSLADADQYQLSTAALQTQKSASAADRFTDSAGRTFVGPTNVSLEAAAGFLTPDGDLNAFTLPYDRLRTDPAAAGAYPGTLLISADVPTQYLSPADATSYAKILAYVAGPGQVPGTTLGQLPAGYLPMTDENGLAALVNYTKSAAAAVQAQTGDVPSVTGQTSPPTATTPTPDSTQAGSSQLPPLGVVSAPAGSHAASTARPGGRPAVSPTAQASAGQYPGEVASYTRRGGTSTTAASIGQTRTPGKTEATQPQSAPATQLLSATASRNSGALGLVLPALLALALASGLGSAWVGRVGRR